MISPEDKVELVLKGYAVYDVPNLTMPGGVPCWDFETPDHQLPSAQYFKTEDEAWAAALDWDNKDETQREVWWQKCLKKKK